MSMQKVAPEKCQKKIFEELKELEEQKTREALELFQRKHKLVKWEGEMERARILQEMELSIFRSFGQFLLWFLLKLSGT